MRETATNLRITGTNKVRAHHIKKKEKKRRERVLDLHVTGTDIADAAHLLFMVW